VTSKNEVLRYIWQHQSVHRKQMVSVFNCRPNLITDTVRELISEKWVSESGRKAIKQGRAPITLKVNTEDKAVVAASYHHNLRVAIVNSAGNILLEEKKSKISSKPEQIAQQISELAGNLSGKYKGEIIGVGIADPGMVDPVKNEVIKSSTFPEWKNVPMARLVSEKTKLPALLGDSSRFSAMAQYWALPEFREAGKTMFYVDYDTNLGFVLVTPEGLFTGASFAGELAHVVMDTEGPDCKCGARGCLEVLAGGYALIEKVNTRLSSGAESSLKNQKDISIINILEAAAAGDRLAKSAVSGVLPVFALALALAVSAYHPSVIVVGAGTREASIYLSHALGNALFARLQPELASMTEVRAGEESGTLVLSGAGLTVFNEIIMKEKTRFIKA
jgi:predicted NBD/HSP70 family sugar kinase